MDYELIETYLFEMNILLEKLDDLVMTAESKGTFTADEVNEMFRIMHTLKGSSAMMEFDKIKTVAHSLEDLFYLIRENTMEVVPKDFKAELFDIIFQTIDFFRGEIDKLERNEPLTNNIDIFAAKVSEFIIKIKNENLALTATELAINKLCTPSSSPRKPTAKNTKKPYSLHVFFDHGSGMEHLRALMLVNSITECCNEEIFDYHPSDFLSNPSAASFIVDNGFIINFATEEARETAIPVIKGSGSVSAYECYDNLEKELEAVKTTDGNEIQLVAMQTVKIDTEERIRRSGIREKLISVNLSKLDKLVSIVDEIALTQSMVTNSPDLKGLKLDNFNSAAKQLLTLTEELRGVSMSLRMVPVSGTFQKMKRIVRDMSKNLNRPTSLILSGEDTEVDKIILDSIGDPLMHIIRNSMDHGIEKDVEDRIKAGKEPVGKIKLSARQTGSDVIIEIEDDGCGVDYEKVLEKAIRRGAAQVGTNYTHKEIINFLLMPGFSTNNVVTEYSGRGVGMDVVKSNIERVAGTVTISSESGKGMKTTLRIPLTLAIMDGIKVLVGESIFTIPINSVRQVFKATEKDVVKNPTKGEYIKLTNSLCPLLRIKDIFALECGASKVEDGILLLVESGDNTFCVLVDALIGEQQVVVKPLPHYLNGYGIKEQGIAGCTILGDGNISIILDIANVYFATQYN